MRKVENTIGDIVKEEACSTTAPANHTELGAESFIFPFFCEVESERVGLSLGDITWVSSLNRCYLGKLPTYCKKSFFFVSTHKKYNILYFL